MCIFARRYTHFSHHIKMGNKNKEMRFKQLFSDSYSRLYYSSIYVVRDPDIAKDIVNDVFTDLWPKFDPDDSSYNFSFLFTIVRNRSIDYLRHKEVHNRFAQYYIKTTEYITEAGFDEREDRLQQVFKLIEQMPPRTKFIVEECYLKQKKYSEVAEILGITIDGVRKQIMKALSIIRKDFDVNYKKGHYPKE